MKNNFIAVVIILFALLSGFFYMLQVNAPQFSLGLLMGANIIMALLTIIGHFIVRKQISSRPQAFVRGVYSATFLKLMVCIAGILVYVLVNRPNVHKPSLFMTFGIYAIYTIFETMMLSKMAKTTK
jgi:hypothetical protein